MKGSLITNFYGAEAVFLINAKSLKIVNVKKLGRERKAVQLIIEAEN